MSGQASIGSTAGIHGDRDPPLARFCIGGRQFVVVCDDGECPGADPGRVGTMQLSGRTYAICAIAEAMDGADPLALLTPREMEIAMLIAADQGTKAIARRLGISPFTVDTHVNRMLVKLGVHSRRGLSARIVHRLGEVPCASHLRTGANGTPVEAKLR